MMAWQASKGGKWPKLIDLHTNLLGVGFDGAHEALADVRACAKVFFKMKELNLINLNNFN